MHEDELARLADLTEMASPGPWHGDETGVYDDIGRKMCPMFIDSFADLYTDEEIHEARAGCTARFMAASREAVPALLAEVRSLREALNVLAERQAEIITERDALRVELASVEDCYHWRRGQCVPNDSA